MSETLSHTTYRLLLSIVGDFDASVLPVFHHYAEEVDLHLLIYDADRSDARQARRLLRGMERYRGRRPGAAVTLPLPLDFSDPAAVETILEKIRKLRGDRFDGVLFNATDGASRLSFPLGCGILAGGGTLLDYDRFENRCELLTAEARHSHPCRPCDIPTHLELLGYELLDPGDAEALEARRAEVLALGLDLARYKEFADALARTRDPDAVAGYDDIKARLAAIGKLDDIHYVQGRLFEEFVYFLLRESGWFDDVRTGVQVRFDEEVENEFDILMIRDNHLHTIECKLVNRLDGEETVYKTDTVMEYLDDDGRAMILSVGAPNERRSRRGAVTRQFSRGDRARARHAQIAIHQRHRFDPKGFLVDVYDWFVRPYRDPDDKETP